MSSYSKRAITQDRQLLLAWYNQNQRNLPWRNNGDPYRIWLSEVMLQQTTVKAVIPYFEKFTERFPAVDQLAAASREEIYELWAGLGYYSRARSLHKAAMAIVQRGGFPQNHRELLALPGLGDYTARAVASIAFGEKVGVVDGNVIRVLSRRWNQPWEWWKTSEKKEIQNLADRLADHDDPSLVNQGMMELGATICTPKSPTCFLCPWQRQCQAYQQATTNSLPLKRDKRAPEIWHWQPALVIEDDKLALVKNDYAPFLKGQLLLPGSAKRLMRAPKNFDFKHGITHHQIYVKVTYPAKIKCSQPIHWVHRAQLKQQVPFSLVQKVIALDPH